MRRYKIWFQPNVGKSILMDGTQIFFESLTDSQRKGLLKGFQALTGTDPMWGQRIHFTPIPPLTQYNFRVMDPVSGEIYNPANPPLSTTELDISGMYDPLIIQVYTPEYPLYSNYPDIYQGFMYYVLMKPSNYANYALIIPLINQDEYNGFADIFEWFGFDPRQLILRIEDSDGNVIYSIDEHKHMLMTM